MIDQVTLKQYLSYDVDTGEFRWECKKAKSTRIGSVAGHNDVSGYRIIRINKVNYRAHRLAFLYVEGHLPEKLVDHIDGDRLNNSWANLRQANVYENGFNSGIPQHNSSGFKGVSYCKLNKKFRAQAKVFGVNKTLGYYLKAEDASNKYQGFIKELHGDFYRETTPLQGS